MDGKQSVLLPSPLILYIDISKRVFSVWLVECDWCVHVRGNECTFRLCLDTNNNNNNINGGNRNLSFSHRTHTHIDGKSLYSIDIRPINNREPNATKQHTERIEVSKIITGERCSFVVVQIHRRGYSAQAEE